MSLLHSRVAQVFCLLAAAFWGLFVVGSARADRWVLMAVFALATGFLLYVAIAAPLRGERYRRMQEQIEGRVERDGPLAERLGTAFRLLREHRAQEDPTLRRQLRVRLALAAAVTAVFVVLSVVLTRST